MSCQPAWPTSVGQVRSQLCSTDYGGRRRPTLSETGHGPLSAPGAGIHAHLRPAVSGTNGERKTRWVTNADWQTG